MDIDTTPPSTHHDARGMQLDLPSDDVMMEVDPDFAPMTAPLPDNPQPTLTSPLPTRTHDPPTPGLRVVPAPPVVLINSSDLPAWPKFKLDQLFVEWLARSESKTWLDALLDDARAGKPVDTLAATHATRRADRTMSPGPSRSPTTTTPVAPGSPVSRLFSNHIPFGDSDSSPRSPPSTPSATVSPFRPTLGSPLAADFELGSSGTASLAADVDPAAAKPHDSSKEDVARSLSPADLQLGPDSKVLDSVADGIAGMKAVVDVPPAPDVAPTHMKIDFPLEAPRRVAEHMVSATPVQPMSQPATPQAHRETGPVAKQDDVQAATPELSGKLLPEAADPAAQVQESTPSDVVKVVQQPTASAPSPLAPSAPSAARVDGMVEEAADNAKMEDNGMPPAPVRNSLKSPGKGDIPMTELAAKRKILPKFYFPCGRDAEVREKREREMVKEVFKAQRTQKKSAGVTRADIAELVVEVIGLPSYFASIVFNAIQELFPLSAIESDTKMANTENETMASDGPRTTMDATNKSPTSGGGLGQSVSGATGQQKRLSEGGGTNSDTTMGDVDESQTEEKRANGFHSGSQDQGVTSGAVHEASAPLENPRTQPAETAGEIVTEAQFMAYYNAMSASRSKEGRLFFALLEPRAKRNYLIPNDFKPLLRALLMCHQGLAFLHATPEFQQRYSETVIERIYFGCTRQHNGRLTLQDIIRSKLLDTLMVVDEEEDINRERKYFSYEHFYVLYCRFWELDANHDLQIDREDLMRYGGHSLTYRIVDRIFGGYARPLDSPENPGFMSYTDFIWFCLSEEDKTSDTAIDYWFRCVDMDGDGLITMYDMEFFYKEQLHRMECFGHEPVQIRDILCQLLDMIKPNVDPPVIRRRDLKRCRLAGNFFNVLFNLNKFFAIEARDPLQIRQEHATPELTDWDRFAALEYLRLSAEEEGEEDESWEDVGEPSNPLIAGEAPF